MALNSEIKNLPDRLRLCAAIIGDGKTMCRILDINQKTLTNWYKGISEPKASQILLIAKSANVSPAWLLAGDDTPEKPVAPESSVQTLDPELHRWIIDGLTKLYKEIGLRMPPGEMGYKAAELHNEIIQEFSDLDQQRSALKLHLKLYRAELVAQPIQPGKGEQESG